jgi:hypothetical protein
VTGIFLGFTATEQSIYYQDTTSKCIKIATHVSFDEAGYTLPTTARTHLQHTPQAAEAQDHMIKQHRLQLLDMTKGTPGNKLPRWRSILKRAIILTVDKHNVRNTSELESIVMQA